MQVSIKKAKVIQKEYFCLTFTLMTWTCSRLNNFSYFFWIRIFKITEGAKEKN